MVTAKELVGILSVDYGEIAFKYNGKNSGVTSSAENFIVTYNLWYGDVEKQYYDVDELTSDPIYYGKRLNDLADKIDFDVY